MSSRTQTHAARSLNPSLSYVRIWFGFSFTMSFPGAEILAVYRVRGIIICPSTHTHAIMSLEMFTGRHPLMLCSHASQLPAVGTRKHSSGGNAHFGRRQYSVQRATLLLTGILLLSLCLSFLEHNSGTTLPNVTDFYRTMLCIRGTSHGPCIRLSVCPSITSRCSTKTDKQVNI